MPYIHVGENQDGIDDVVEGLQNHNGRVTRKGKWLKLILVDHIYHFSLCSDIGHLERNMMTDNQIDRIVTAIIGGAVIIGWLVLCGAIVLTIIFNTQMEILTRHVTEVGAAIDRLQ